MRPDQARVFIVESHKQKRLHLEDFIEGQGGVITDWAGSVDRAKDALSNIALLNNINRPNIVLLSSALTKEYYAGDDEGSQIFNSGYKTGSLRSARSKEGLGILAVGSSDSSSSCVADTTGANFCLEENGNEDRWAELLEGHTDTPEVAPPKTINRQQCRHEGLGDVVNKFFAMVSSAPELVALTVSEEIVKDGRPVIINYPLEDERLIGRVINREQLASNMSAVKTIMPPRRENDLLSHSARVAIKTDSRAIFFEHKWILNTERRDSFDSEVWYDGNVDDILNSRLNDVPQSYWQEVGIDPGLFKGSQL